jgi:hypothetical protein
MPGTLAPSSSGRTALVKPVADLLASCPVTSDFLANNWAKHEWFSEPETKEK